MLGKIRNRRKDMLRGVWNKGIVVLMAIVASGLTVASCGKGKNAENGGEHQIVPLKYAEYLKIKDYDGYEEVTIRNPWDTTKILHKYILVPKDSEMPPSLPKGDVIRTPVKNTLVYSTVHAGLMKELGAMDAIGGMCGTEYVNDPDLRQLIAQGKIADCGSTQTPVIERIIKLQPEAILLSPYENDDKYSKTGELGIPIIEGADYMEVSPLGRAEWVRFYGMLFGKKTVADSMFADTERKYLELKSKAATAANKPRVLMDQRYGSVWYVPGAESTTAKIIADAGGINPFDYIKKAGSESLSPEKVLYEAHDADIWFIKYFQDNDKTMEEFTKDSPANSQVKAFRQGNVYGCNTKKVNFFEETPYHPDRLLEDYISLMHPELNVGNGSRHYFKRLE